MTAPSRIPPGLEFAHRALLADPKALRWERLLQELAEAFEAAGAGVAAPLEGMPAVVQRVRPQGDEPKPSRWPWGQPEVLVRLRQELAAVPAHVDGVGFLLAAVRSSGGASGIIWLESAADRAWNAAECAGLALAAQVLGPRLALEPSAQGALSLDRVRLQQRLNDAALMAGRTAHAFDNVLTGILGFAELTLTQLPPGSMPGRYVAEVLQAAQQGTQLTHQLHQFSRCGQTRPGPASLALVLGEIEGRARQALKPGVSLSAVVPADLPPVALEAEPLRLVLTHLIDNALEAMPGGGQVMLTARRVELSEAECRELLGDPAPGIHVEVEVHDTGAGLTPEARRKLFHEPLFSTKPRHAGLGLAVVHRTLQVNRGGLRLEPDSEKGTTVRIWLPVAERAIRNG